MEDKSKLRLVQGKINPFSIESLRLPQNFGDILKVEKVITYIPVRKPHRQEFIRVHPDPNMMLETVLYEDQDDRETYIVNPELWSTIGQELTPKVLFPYLNHKGILKLWPIKLPGQDGQLDTWNESALKHAKTAKDTWIRVASNKDLGAYEVFRPLEALPEPEWPRLTMEQIIGIAFENRLIDNASHPVVKGLGIPNVSRRGEL